MTKKKMFMRERFGFTDRNGVDMVRVRVVPSDWPGVVFEFAKQARSGLHGWLYVPLDDLIALSMKAVDADFDAADEIVATRLIDESLRLVLDNAGPELVWYGSARFFVVDDGALHFITASCEADAWGFWVHHVTDLDLPGPTLRSTKSNAAEVADRLGLDEPVVRELTHDEALSFRIFEDDADGKNFRPFGVCVLNGYHGCSEW